jgi:TPP-dependent pyruvate/acetoin dehydrogenase alpha subunit
MAERAGAYGMPAVTVDGSDFFAVYEAVAEAVQRGRGGGGPSAIEAVASRYYGHFEGDAQQYRDSEELKESRLANDPIPRFLAAERCSDLDSARLEQIDADILSSLDAGFERAFAAAEPTLDQLYTDVYVNYRGESA